MQAQLWTCGMHPQVIRDQPGFCPICGMELTPLRTGAADTAAAELLTIDPVVVQNMGLRIDTVKSGRLHRQVRAVGYLEEAQPNQHDVNLRVSGWVERLHAATEGEHVAAGAPLFDLYSPELTIAIEELIAARKAHAQHASETTRAVLAASERRLRLLGLTQAQVDRYARAEQAPDTVTFTSPIAGHLVSKPIVSGSAVEAGQLAMRIVDHSRLWLDAQVFEHQISLVHLGQPTRATIQSFPGQEVSGTVFFIHPHVDPMTRTAMVRIAIDNPAMELRPGMYAGVEIEVGTSDETLLVPRAAVIDSGTRQIAFVARDEGQFETRRLRVGQHGAEGQVEILEGLSEGERVVVSGQFLLDSESRLQEAIRKHLAEGLLTGGESEPPPAHQH